MVRIISRPVSRIAHDGLLPIPILILEEAAIVARVPRNTYDDLVKTFKTSWKLNVVRHVLTNGGGSIKTKVITSFCLWALARPIRRRWLRVDQWGDSVVYVSSLVMLSWPG